MDKTSAPEHERMKLSEEITAGMTIGLEAQLSLCVDMLFPVTALVDLCKQFRDEFPSVDLRVDTQGMTGVSARVLDGSASLGVAAPMGVLPGLSLLWYMGTTFDNYTGTRGYGWMADNGYLKYQPTHRYGAA